MAYVTINYKSKAALKRAITDPAVHIGVFQPGPFSDGEPFYSGVYSIEGPWYPEPHKWYGRATVEHGRIVKVV